MSSKFGAARAYGAEAFEVARFIEHDELSAWVRGTQSLAAYYTGDYKLSLTLARDGQRYAKDGIQGVRLAINGEAQALGKLRDRRGMAEAVDRSYRLLERFPPAAGMTPCISFGVYSEARTVSNAATAYLAIGDTKQVPPSEELLPEEQDWHRFRQLSQLGNHWERPGWADGRRSYHWLLTFEYPSALHTLAAQRQEPFRNIVQFDLVPLDTLHLTIQRVAFTDELSAASLAAVATAVSEQCQQVAPFGLHTGWLAGSAGAIRLTALPVAPLATVRNGYHAHSYHRLTRRYSCLLDSGILATRQHCLQQYCSTCRADCGSNRSVATLATCRGADHQPGIG